VKEKADKEDAVGWGKEVDGLQGGLAADARSVRQRETIKFTVKLRNVGNADIKFTHGLLREYAPEVTAADGVGMSVYMPVPKGYKVRLVERVIKPGETITLYNPEVAVESEDRAKVLGEMLVDAPTICVAPGKYKIAYGGMIQSHPKLTTGEVDFEVKDPVAWGKEAGGLQAGLCISNANDIRIGGQAKMVVRLRNVSKETIKVSAWPLWTCYPGVVDARGDRVRTTVAPSPLFEIIPASLTLKPGETIDAGKSDLLVAEPDQKVTVPNGVVDMCAIHVKPGLYKANCIGFVKEDHTLATGTVNFKVKPAIPADEQQREAPQDSASEYPTADIVIQYRDESGREVRDLKQFRVEDAATVAKLASHFPGILGERGSGPRTTAGKRATLTIKFKHKSGEVSRARVAHVTSDYATWWWRDNTPYTGDRDVEGKDQLQRLIELLAAKHKVDLK
jgi:hypothetical protein